MWAKRCAINILIYYINNSNKLVSTLCKYKRAVWNCQHWVHRVRTCTFGGARVEVHGQTNRGRVGVVVVANPCQSAALVFQHVAHEEVLVFTVHCYSRSIFL